MRRKGEAQFYFAVTFCKGEAQTHKKGEGERVVRHPGYGPIQPGGKKRRAPTERGKWNP